ncbi:hypothetical protein G9A89_005493 [Geosiphon pyriformis]|nr:hypothetical protein G9A89_005493 [Geosiphon pyriformis]
MSESKIRVAVITGANSGIGFATAQRLLKDSSSNSSESVKIILACRNLIRADKARNELLKEFPDGDVEIIIVDVSSVKSVFVFCKTLKERYQKIDWLFCNAGILACDHINWWLVCREIVTHPVRLLTESRCLVQPLRITDEGLGETFACNFFGHFVMVNELEDLLAASHDPRVVWVSSCSASRKDYDKDDFQCLKGKYPYESSKYLIDIVGVALNGRFRNRNIHSFVTHPGVVATNIIRDNLGWVMANVMSTCFYLARFCGVNEETVTSWNGSFSNYYVVTKNPIESLKTNVKYGTYIKPWGSVYIREGSIDQYDEKEATELLKKLYEILKNFKNE